MKKALSICAAAAVAVATLSACHPPNENPTVQKVKTATGVAAPTAKVTSTSEAMADLKEEGDPSYVDCGMAAEELPSTIHLSCHSDKDTNLVKSITWSSIGSKQAVGSGTLVQDGETTKGVKVVLSEPKLTAEGYVYTELSVNGQSMDVH